MIYFFGIDNVICKTNGTDYERAQPNYDRISCINKLFDDGHIIYYNSDRERKTRENCTLLLYQQLKDWGCMYTCLKLDILEYDSFVDINATQPNDFFTPVKNVQ